MLHHVGIEVSYPELPQHAEWDNVWQAWLALDYVNIGGALLLIEYVCSAPKRALRRHVCFEVSNLDAILQGKRILAGPSPAHLFQGRRAAFVLQDGEVIEYLEAAS